MFRKDYDVPFYNKKKELAISVNDFLIDKFILSEKCCSLIIGLLQVNVPGHLMPSSVGTRHSCGVQTYM